METKGSSISSALYDMAAAPQRIDKDTEQTANLKRKLSKHTVGKETQERLKQMKQERLNQNGQRNAHFERSRLHITWADYKPAHQPCRTSATIDR